MKRSLIFCLIFALVGCSKSNEKENISHNEYAINVNPETIQCGADSRKSEKIYTLVRDLVLKNEPNETGGFVINIKATEYSGERNYRSLYIGEQVKEYCTKNGYSFITTASDPHIFQNSGWVLESDLKQKTGDKYEGRISSFVMQEKGAAYYEGAIEKFLNIKPGILELEILAAKKVIDSGKCDFVESSMIDRFGDDINNPDFVVECKNGQNFKLSKNGLMGNSKSILSNEEKSISKQDAMEQCKELVRRELNHKNTVEFHEILGTTYNINSKSGNVALIMNFEAENALRQKNSFKAKCIFTPDGKKEVSFRND